MHKMPIQKQARPSRPQGHECRSWTNNECLVQLRKRELLAYHHICGVFRAQGHLTPDKLKLLKEVGTALYITEARHRNECRMAVNDQELTAIATSVAGPNSDIEWRREARDVLPVQGRVNTASIELLDYIAKAAKEALEELEKSEDENLKTVTKSINIDNRFFHFDHDYDMKEPVPELHFEQEIKRECNDEELSSSVSSTTESIEDSSIEGDDKHERATEKSDPDIDLMPPPPPLTTATGLAASLSPVSSSFANMTSTSVVTVSSTPTAPMPSLSSVITVPPASSFMTVPTASSQVTMSSPASVITVPSLPSVITVPTPSGSTTDSDASSPASASVIPSSAPATGTTAVLTPVKSKTHQSTVLSDTGEMQIVSFTDPLPQLVVVPPAETQPSNTLILPTGVSINVKDVGDAKKRKRVSSESGTSSGQKTMTISQFSKMAPVMVPTVNMPGQVPKKMPPILNRSRTQSTLSSPSPKVIIVSNQSPGNTQLLQRSLSMSMGMPVLRTTTPRLQSSVVQSGTGAKPRPKMVAVSTRVRGKSPGTPNRPNIIRQENVKVSAAESMKKVPVGYQQTKILPKPQSMFLLNTGKSAQKPSNTSSVGQTRMVSPRMNIAESAATTVKSGGGNKQSVVFLQKGSGNQRTVALTNTSKDLMQKLMSKKCVVIQSSKGLPKGVSAKQHTYSTSTGKHGQNVMLFDLSQDQFRQNLPTTTLNEILQACSTASTATTPTTSTNTITLDPDVHSSLMSEEASKSLRLEEVSLSIGQSESIVTLGEAVDLLGGDGSVQTESGISHMLTPLPAVTAEPVPPPLVPTQADTEMDPMDPASQILDITPEELAASEISFMPINKPAPQETNPTPEEAEEVETVAISSEVELECEDQTTGNDVEIQEIVFQTEDDNVIEELDEMELIIPEQDENEVTVENSDPATEMIIADPKQDSLDVNESVEENVLL